MTQTAESVTLKRIVLFQFDVFFIDIMKLNEKALHFPSLRITKKHSKYL